MNTETICRNHKWNRILNENDKGGVAWSSNQMIRPHPSLVSAKVLCMLFGKVISAQKSGAVAKGRCFYFYMGKAGHDAFIKFLI